VQVYAVSEIWIVHRLCSKNFSKTQDGAVNHPLFSVNKQYLKCFVFVRIAKSYKIGADTKIAADFSITASADKFCTIKAFVACK
jgi:hypothetical protein